MIDFIKGSVAYHGNDFVVVNVNGMGYQIYGTNPFQYQIDESIMLFTHFIVREDAHLLYGFSSESERDLFRLLLEVSGVGPKAGIAILAGSEPSQIVRAVQTEDISELTRFPGIGKKTAQRIVLDLKDKLKEWSTANLNTMAIISPADENRDVIEALLGLGYNEREAKEAMEQVNQQNPDGTISTEEFIRQALQFSIRV